MRYASINNCPEAMTCKCGKEFTCFHDTVRGDMELNHCMKCGRGNHGDTCKGKCPECYARDWDPIEKEVKKMREDASKETADNQG